MTRTIGNIARLTGGKIVRNDLNEEFQINRLSIDSRTLINGGNTLFFALKGINNNGHLYINDLVNKQVKVFVVSEKVEIPANRQVAVIQVTDPLAALQKLAAFHRSQFNYPVIGITGSNGKTIVKEWLHDLLADSFSIVRSPKSYNSQVGVPLSVWNMSTTNGLGIFEAGISKPGEMELLEPIIRPTIGILTNIGDAHQENFKSLQEKAEEKLKLFEYAEKLVFCADQQIVSTLSEDYCKKQNIKPYSWSLLGNKAQVRFTIVEKNVNNRIEAKWKNQTFTFQIPFNDASSIENACHCFTAILALKADIQAIIPEFLKLEPLAMRLELKKGIQNSLLINDYYNSDINSLEIALSVLNHQAEKNHLKKMVILSDIRQSGYSTQELYRKVNHMLEDSGIKTLIGIGHDIQEAEQCFSLSKQLFQTVGEFLSNLAKFNFEHAAILIKGAREFRFEEISSALQQKAHQTVFEINLNRLVGNLNQYRALLKPETKVMVMVKAFSYGTGDVEIAKMLQYQRVDALAVAVADEGVELRNSGITIPVVVMNPEMHSFQHIIDYQLEPNIYSSGLASGFADATNQNAVAEFPVHIKIDTGMNRLGFKSIAELQELVHILKQNPQLRVKSAFSHLVASDMPEFDNFTREQIDKFKHFTQFLEEKLGYAFERHILNTAGIVRFPESQFDMVRLGIGLYGVGSKNLNLQQIGTLKSTVSQVKVVETGETVGYNRAGKITQRSEIAVVPLGYADGLDRRLGNGTGSACIANRLVPVIGNICMDMCMLDVTGLGVKAGDEVEFFGNHISIADVANSIGTIPYELLTGISQRVKRVYIQE